MLQEMIQRSSGVLQSMGLPTTKEIKTIQPTRKTVLLLPGTLVVCKNKNTLTDV